LASWNIQSLSFEAHYLFAANGKLKFEISNTNHFAYYWLETNEY